MTTPTVNKVEEFRAEMLTKISTTNENVESLKETIAILAEASANLLAEIAAVRNDVTWIGERMTTALDRFQTASSSQPAKAGESVTFWATNLRHDQSGKKHAYFLLGGPYAKFGVRVWPEVLPVLGLAEFEQMPPDEYRLEKPVNVRASIEEYEKDGESKTGPKKVVGLA